MPALNKGLPLCCAARCAVTVMCIALISIIAPAKGRTNVLMIGKDVKG
jgi:hypothetical protein